MKRRKKIQAGTALSDKKAQRTAQAKKLYFFPVVSLLLKRRIYNEQESGRNDWVGCAYALNCRPCMEVHQRMAVEAGLTPEEIQAALGVADAVKEGAAKKNRDFADGLRVREGGTMLPPRQCMLRVT